LSSENERSVTVKECAVRLLRLDLARREVLLQDAIRKAIIV
jgi:hypothetical protein